MNKKSKLSEFLIAFCVCTTCITLLQGTLGMVFYPEESIRYDAFFVPPIFGLLSVILGMITETNKELSVPQVLIRRCIHLILIEGMVFGTNYIAGNVFEPLLSAVLAIGIAVIFVLVYVILWINDQRSAEDFNKRLKEFQAENSKV